MVDAIKRPPALEYMWFAGLSKISGIPWGEFVDYSQENSSLEVTNLLRRMLEEPKEVNLEDYL